MKAYQFWATFHYGGWSITFRKDISLPVYPNSDMVISDGDVRIDLSRNWDSHKTTVAICYDAIEKKTTVCWAEYWSLDISLEEVSSLVESYQDSGWSLYEDEKALQSIKELIIRKQGGGE